MPELTSMASAVGALLKEKQHTVGVCESASGGLISAALVAIPGASAYYLGGGVSYTQASRQGLLRIPAEALAGMRASTEPHTSASGRYLGPERDRCQRSHRQPLWRCCRACLYCRLRADRAQYYSGDRQGGP
jgi:hypothetical protein